MPPQRGLAGIETVRPRGRCHRRGGRLRFETRGHVDLRFVETVRRDALDELVRIASGVEVVGGVIVCGIGGVEVAGGVEVVRGVGGVEVVVAGGFEGVLRGVVVVEA